MKCTKYPDREADGTCSYTGKPYCKEELVEIEGKLVSRDNMDRFISSLRELANTQNRANTPMVFMNAGGGGGGSSSSAAAAVAAPQAPAYTPVLSQKSRTTAALLAILLGGLGVHKFYLGKPVQGLIYLAFCWTFIPAIVAFIEGIAYFGMSDLKFAQRFG